MKKLVPLGEIVCNKKLQTRAGKLDQDHVDDLAFAYQKKEEVPEPRVWQIKGRPNYHLTRGFHRIAALEQINRKSVECEVKSGTWAEAVLDAVEGNIGHGLRRSNKDKRAAVEALIEAYPDWSDREIAKRAGVEHHLVAEVRVGDSPTSGKNQQEKPSVLDGLRKTMTALAKEALEPQSVDEWRKTVINTATEIARIVKSDGGLF